jgi:hypothetical protein
MRIIVSVLLFDIFTLRSRKHDTIAVWPFVITRRARAAIDRRLINHERIHLRQQVEMLIIPFYLWYAVEFLLRRTRKDAYGAYLDISFEREARSFEADDTYLQKRKPWAWLRYVRHDAQNGEKQNE